MNSAVSFWFLAFGILASFEPWARAREECKRTDLDIFIVLDSSRSINERNFEHLRQFLSHLVGRFKVGEFESRIGLMQFSNQMRTAIEFNFGKHRTVKGIQENIKRLIHHDGRTTYTGNALKLVNRHVFPGEGNKINRPDAEKVLLLVTDGAPYDPDLTLKEADKLKEKGVYFITVAAGSNRWIANFKQIITRLGSKPTHNHRAEFRDLERIIDKLVRDICTPKVRQPAPPHKCFQEKQDVLIMIDGSKTMGEKNFRKVKIFLQDFLSRLDVGPSRVHVGVVQFSEGHLTKVEIALNQYTTVTDLIGAVMKIVYQNGKEADMLNALRLANLMILSGGDGDRITAPDTIIIFTDGNFNDGGVQHTLRKLRDKKARIVSVGVGRRGRQFKEDKVDALAIGSGDVFDLATLDSSTFLDDIAPTTCKMTACTSAAPKCSPENQDVLFLVDGASKIGKFSFRTAQKFIKRLLGKMTLGKNQTHVGIIQYGSTGRVDHVMRLSKQGALRSLVADAASRMKFMNDKRNSDLPYALSIASDTLLNPSTPGREGVAKTLVLISDGDIEDFSEAESIAKTLRNRGVRVLTLSNGKQSNKKTFVSSLRLIASGLNEYYVLGKAQFNGILNGLQKTVCISRPEIPETCFTQKRRIFFALDSSAGRGPKKFREVKDFMESMVTKLQIGLSQSQVGYLQYDDGKTSRDRVVFEKNETVEMVLWRIKNMKYRQAKRSYLGHALRIINREVFPDSNPHYSQVKDILIIIAHKEVTDAQLAFDEAEKLKNKGVEIISIATGTKKRVGTIRSQLQVISTSATNTHSADYTALWTIVDEVLVNVCGLGQCTSFMATTCIPKKQDIAFVIDSSRSIGDLNYFRLQRFTQRLASRLDLAKGRTHIGVLQVGSREKTNFQFNMGEHPDRSDVLYLINDMTYLDSEFTHMGDGLQKIRLKVFNKDGPDRADIPNTLVIFSDGGSHDTALMKEETRKLKSMGVKILVVGYGVNVTVHSFSNTLQKMATNERDVFSINFGKNDLVLEEQISVIAKHLLQVDCPRAFRPPVECSQGAVDLFLLVDGSRSINPRNFKLVKRFLKKLTSEFDVGENGTHIGMFQFSDVQGMRYEFSLSDMKNNKQVRRGIRRMKYHAGTKTLTGHALRIIDSFIFVHQQGDRPDVPDVLVLFTDGHAHDFPLAKKHANAMKARGIHIVTVAAGQETRKPKAKLMEQLEEIASDPLSVYAAQFDELTDLVDKLIDVDCVVRPRKNAL